MEQGWKKEPCKDYSKDYSSNRGSLQGSWGNDGESFFIYNKDYKLDFNFSFELNNFIGLVDALSSSQEIAGRFEENFRRTEKLSRQIISNLKDTTTLEEYQK